MADGKTEIDGTEAQAAKSGGVERGAVSVPNFKHGLYAKGVPPEFLELERYLCAASVEDDGGASEVPARRLAQHGYRALVHRQIAQLSAALDGHGITDRRGKLRVAWLQRLEGLIATAIRIDTLLGLERRPRKVNDLTSYIEDRYGAHNVAGTPSQREP